PIPTGWQSYTDKRAPFAIAYPPDWQAANSGTSVNFAPGPGPTLFQVTAVNNPTPGASLEQLRETGWKQVLGSCDSSEIAATGDDTYSGIAFADLNAFCVRGQQRLTIYLAAGVQGDLVWYIYVIGPTDSFSDDADAYYDPMLTTLDIGGTTQA